MPYSNLPKSQWAKMDRCVAEAMAENQKLAKQSAIKICYSSISKKDDDMSNARVKRKKLQGQPKAIEETPVVGEQVMEAQSEGKDMEGEMGYEAPSPLSSDMMYMPTYGATSFADLDKARAEMHVAKTQRMATEDYQSIISSIMYDPSVEDKVAAIKSVSEEFATRLSVIAKKDNPIVEFVKAFKAKMTGAAINDLPDSDFAYIESGGKKDEGGKTIPRSLRHFPIHDAAHVRNALARASQSPFGSKAMLKIRAAAKKMGVHMASEKKENQAIQIFKDTKGQWRWLGIPTNNFIDRAEEIITDSAHKEFVKFLDEHPEQAPLFCPWHVLEGARKSRADFWDYDNGFMIMSGPLTEEEAGALMASKEENVLGMSHGFFALNHDPLHKNLITQYRTFEVSDLPLRNAANPWTSLDVLAKENKMDANKRKYLVGYIGEDAVAAIEQKISQGKDALTVLGVQSKAASVPTPDEEPAEPNTDGGDSGGEDAPEEEGDAMKALADALKSELGMEALSALLEKQSKDFETLQATVKAQADTIAAQTLKIGELSKNSDQKIAEQIVPAGTPLFWLKGKKASESDDTKVGEDEAKNLEADLKVGEPHWLSGAILGQPKAQ